MVTAPSTISLVVLVGPTAVGKTALSLDVAAAVEGEIVSADSRLFYRGMDIGTAKPTDEDRTRVHHHLIDIVSPVETITLGEYQRMAQQAIDDIATRGKIPLLVGGSGQYVRAVVEGWNVPVVPPDVVLRETLAALAANQGSQALHDKLEQLDPIAAQRIDHRNVRRVIRALEVTLKSGEPISSLQTKSPPPYEILQVGLTRPRVELYQRIDRRIDAMIAAGLVQEVGALGQAYGWDAPALSGLGYRQMGYYVRGELAFEDAVQLLRKETRRFVRQQSNWFHQQDPRIQWFDLSRTSGPAVVTYIRDWRADRGHL
jgi:tRNA dimethylallyltransferase